MERMGHSSTRAALIYLHATRERDEAIAAGMGQLFTNAKKTATKPSRSGTRPPTCPLKIKKLNDHSPDLGRNHKIRPVRDQTFLDRTGRDAPRDSPSPTEPFRGSIAFQQH